MIYEIDCKIMHVYIKMFEAEKWVHDKSVEEINQWMKDNGKDYRCLKYSDLIYSSKKGFVKIQKILDDELMQKRFGSK